MNIQIPRLAWIAMFGLLVAGAASIAWRNGPGMPAPAGPEHGLAGQPVVSASLKVGAPVRLPESTLWLSGKAPAPLGNGSWTVIDIVGLWCPYCPATAPGLVELAEKHRKAGLKFITLASTDAPGMAEYARKWGIEWPVGHSVSTSDLAAIGAFNETARIPGYEAKPTLLLVDPQGNLAWTDNHSRFRHENPSATLRELEEAIAKRAKAN